MKTIEMIRDHQFRVCATVHVQYRAGVIYKRVPEVQVRDIVAAGAGRIVDE